jgi:predicted CoA-binding protein
LRDRGYDVFAVSPNADQVEGDRCYHDLRSIPGAVDPAVIATGPEVAEETLRERAELGINHVWMHRGPGPGGVSDRS